MVAIKRAVSSKLNLNSGSGQVQIAIRNLRLLTRSEFLNFGRKSSMILPTL